ncbi:hypothetical protein BC936DRAFT_141100 [Jimgerdemannia flammicorona]|uniref:Uncharacterized protein n=1 Tax=Jimgerdemannia flammicorona TaxID=994334 RepID=A0A433DGC4_9FUNG|nr:hypothetical protein BC936DRAFT_141100 [Jimgerdemannia flammicorona]
MTIPQTHAPKINHSLYPFPTNATTPIVRDCTWSVWSSQLGVYSFFTIRAVAWISYLRRVQQHSPYTGYSASRFKQETMAKSPTIWYRLNIPDREPDCISVPIPNVTTLRQELQSRNSADITCSASALRLEIVAPDIKTIIKLDERQLKDCNGSFKALIDKYKIDDENPIIVQVPVYLHCNDFIALSFCYYRRSFGLNIVRAASRDMPKFVKGCF